MTKIRQEFPDTTRLSEDVSVTLHLSSNQRHDFNSWEEFDTFDSTQKQRTKSLSFVYIYNMIGSDENLESYRVQVSVQNVGNKFGIYFGPIAISRIEDAGIPPVTIHATVDYKNYIRGKNILSTIDGWVEALPKEENKLVDFFERHGATLSGAAHKISVVLCVASILPFAPSENGTIRQLGVYLSLSALWIVISWFFASYFSEKIKDLPRKFRNSSTIVFTKGDENHDALIKSKNKTVLRSIFLNSFWIVLQITLGVSSNFVWNYVSGK